MSVLPPGENGITNLIGLVGHVWANAGNAACANSNTPPIAAVRLFTMMTSVVTFAVPARHPALFARLPLLLRFQSPVPDHLRPLRGFFAYLLGEFLRGVSYRCAAILRDARHDIGLVQHGDGFPVPQRDDGGG